MKTQLLVDNIKCGGCAGTIKRELSSMDGIAEVIVDKENETVDLSYESDTHLQSAIDKLLQLGYPQKGTLSGLSKVGANARSYVSCAVGKINS